VPRRHSREGRGRNRIATSKRPTGKHHWNPKTSNDLRRRLTSSAARQRARPSGHVPTRRFSIEVTPRVRLDLETPYEEAQTCLLMAAVCERRGDQDGRRLELDAARKLFTQLGAEPCLVRVADQFERATPSGPAGSLSERETQVLRLLAAGKMNRDIAEALFISEKTVARHVSNIFDKLGVSNRSGATAWAYQHDLI
jgi:DNA-binding CsgD family transcriptional regulator